MKAKPIMIFIFSFLFFSIISKPTLCKDFLYDGFIITLDGDTIYGKIKDLGIKQNCLSCKFLQNNSDTISDYKPGEIYSYTVKNKCFMSKSIDQDNLYMDTFAEILVDGKIDLFMVAIEQDVYYLIDNNDGIQKLINRQREIIHERSDFDKDLAEHGKNLGILKALMQDYPPVFNQIDNVYLKNRKSVASLFVNYNVGVSTNEKCIDYTKAEKKPDIFIGLTSCLRYPTIKYFSDDYFHYLSNAKIERSLSISYGLDLSFDVPSLSDRVSVDLIFEKSKEKFTYNYNDKFESVTAFEFDFHTYSLLINYLVFQKKINIIPYFGFSYLQIVNNVQTRQFEAGYNRNIIKFNNGFYAFNSGVNFDLPLYSNWDLFLRLKAGYIIDFYPMQNLMNLSELYKSPYLGFTFYKQITHRDI